MLAAGRVRCEDAGVGGRTMTDLPAARDGERLDTLLATVLAVHGEHLDEEQREAARLHAERLRQAAALLDGYHLENGDEPDASFQVLDRADAV